MSVETQPIEIIRTEALERDFPMGDERVHALRGINLVVPQGEFLALMGPSGCGKTTLLQVLGCMDSSTAGRYWLEGREVSALTPAQRAALRSDRLGFVFQDYSLLANMNALENVALPLVYKPNVRNVDARAREALAQVGLADRARHRPNQLSGGEQQRVAIARALINHPAILLADEPTGNLDSKTGIEVLEVLKKLWNQGLTILMVTHDASVASYASRVLQMQDGVILDGLQLV
jgi:putative ABC transport system ATP-binding protein